MVRRNHTGLPALLFALQLAACQSPLPAPVPPIGARTAPSAGAQRFVVDPRASEIRLLVYRDGPMARFGHNHIIVGELRGVIRAGDSAAASSFELEIPVASFAVDPAPARAEEGAEFDAEVSEAARRDTRENMLGAEVLDAARHPLVVIESIALSGPRWNPAVRASIRLRGAARELKFPAALVEQAGRLTVIAAFRISQSEFGIAPFSILGGAVRVRDALDVRVRLVALAAGD